MVCAASTILRWLAAGAQGSPGVTHDWPEPPHGGGRWPRRLINVSDHDGAQNSPARARGSEAGQINGELRLWGKKLSAPWMLNAI